MDKSKLDFDLRIIAKKITALSGLSYSDKEYDHIEEEIHSLEDEFMYNYGEFLEEAISKVHNEYCPDNDVLVPIAYLANEYIFKDDSVEVSSGQGVLVDVNDYPDKLVRLALVPSPTRIMLLVGDEIKEEVWKLE